MDYFSAKYDIGDKKVEVFVRQYQGDYLCFRAEIYYKEVEKRDYSQSGLGSKLKPTPKDLDSFEQGWTIHDIPLNGDGLGKMDKKVNKYIRSQLLTRKVALL